MPYLHVAEDNEIDVEKTKAALLRDFPGLEFLPLGRLIPLVERTLLDVRPVLQKRPQHLWLFFLAGRLKGAFTGDDQHSEELAARLTPLAWLFAEMLFYVEIIGSKNRINWADREAVEIEWLNAWTSRKLPVGSSALSDAYEKALDNPLKLEGNKYLSVVANMGFALQVQTNEFPFLLPVNSKVAAILGTTVPTIGSSVAKAIRDGYFKVYDTKYSASARKARMFLFNFDHPDFADNEIVQASYPRRLKLKSVFARAAEILSARPDPVLAEIARSASTVNNSYSPEQIAIVWDNNGEILPSWPDIGYLPDEIWSLNVERFAERLIDVLDELDKHRLIKRQASEPKIHL